jgi:plastocyanin
MAVWSVDIVAGANPGDPATFVARNQPAAPVGTIYADPGDVVSWNNTTTQDHQPVQTNLIPPLGTLVWPVVTPGHQTDAYVVSGNSGTTISYTCLLHSSEQGTIVITPAPPPTA